jgi:O-antigen/teichoic acid export membrane protein
VNTRRASDEDRVTLARGGALNLMGAVAYALFTFFFAVAVGRGLGTAQAGVFFEAIAVLTVLSTLTQLGADTGLVRAIPRLTMFGRLDQLRAHLAVALAPVLVASFAVGAALVVLAPQLSEAIVHGTDEHAAVPYLRVFGVVLPFMTLSRVLLSAARALGAQLPFVLVENVGKGALRLLLAVAVLGTGAGATALAVVTWGVPTAVGFVLSIWIVVVLVRRREASAAVFERVPPGKALYREFWKFSGPFAVAASLQTTLIWLDIILVGALASAHDAGVYAAATRYVALGTVALQAVVLVLGPQFSMLIASGERDRLRAVYQTGTAWLTAVSWPFFLTLVVFAPTFLAPFGQDFRAGQTALVILGLAMLPTFTTGPVGILMLMEGRSRRNLATTCLSAATNIGLNVLLIPRYGIEGAAIAVASGILVGRSIMFAQVWSLTRLNPFTARLALVAGGSAFCYGAVGLAFRLSSGSSPAVLILSSLVATALYAALLWRFRGALELSALARSPLGPHSRPGVSGLTP